MAREKYRASGPKMTEWPFMLGLALIALATAFNIAFDGMDAAERQSLPPFLSELYEQNGKLGVTLAIVTLGMAVIAVGSVLPSRTPPVAVPDGPSADGAGVLALETEKYLAAWRDRRGPDPAWSRVEPGAEVLADAGVDLASETRAECASDTGVSEEVPAEWAEEYPADGYQAEPEDAEGRPA